MISNTSKMANRYGLNLEFFEYKNYSASSTKIAEIKFANEVSLELSSEITWATGGQNHSNKIGFKNPIEGTLKISTQLVSMDMIKLASGGSIDATATPGVVEFKNDTESATPIAFVIKGTTVWQGDDGSTYTEDIMIHKAFVKPGYNVTYNGSNDPQSLDIEFELASNDDNKVVTITRADSAE